MTGTRWTRFLSKHAKQGYTMSQLRNMYKKTQLCKKSTKKKSTKKKSTKKKSTKKKKKKSTKKKSTKQLTEQEKLYIQVIKKMKKESKEKLKQGEKDMINELINQYIMELDDLKSSKPPPVSRSQRAFKKNPLDYNPNCNKKTSSTCGNNEYCNWDNDTNKCDSKLGMSQRFIQFCDKKKKTNCNKYDMYCDWDTTNSKCNYKTQID